MGGFVFTKCTVSKVEKLSPYFLQVNFSGPALRETHWSSGDKVQVFLPEAGMRTYTPTQWDSQRGQAEFVIYLRVDSP